jgi:hypothetical protein
VGQAAPGRTGLEENVRRRKKSRPPGRSAIPRAGLYDGRLVPVKRDERSGTRLDGEDRAVYARTCGDALQRTPRADARRSGRPPVRGDHAYEVKWDGFRAIVSTEGRLRMRSRPRLEHDRALNRLDGEDRADTELGEFVDDRGRDLENS